MLAKKLITVVSRGIANTHSRDFYDILTLLRLKSKDINQKSFHKVTDATASRRWSIDRISDYAAVFEEVSESGIIQGI